MNINDDEVESLCEAIAQAANKFYKYSACQSKDIGLSQTPTGWMADINHYGNYVKAEGETYKEVLLLLKTKFLDMAKS